MSYTINWTQGEPDGRLNACVDRVRTVDFLDIQREINRRMALAYIGSESLASQVAANLPVRLNVLQGQIAPPFDSLRAAVLNLLSLPGGMGGGSPASPASVQWLWPVNDADYGKVLVTGAAGSGEVSLLAKLNASGSWTDSDLSGRYIRAVHVNELRWCLEHIYWNHFTYPVYSGTGILSTSPNTGWQGGMISHSTMGEVHAMAHAALWEVERPGCGLVNVTITNGSFSVSVNNACTANIYQLLRDIQFAGDVPTWLMWDYNASLYWSAPGGTGSGDVNYLGQLAIPANGANSFSNSALIAALQAMVNGRPCNFLLTRYDTSYSSVLFTAGLLVEFQLNS